MLGFVELPAGRDPDDVIQSGGIASLKASFADPLRLDAFLWGYEVRQTDADNPVARARLKTRLAELAEKFTDPNLRAEFGREFHQRFWDAFGWKKTEVDFVRRAIAATSGRAHLQGHDLYVRAILLGLSRYPAVIAKRADQIQALNANDSHLKRWRDLLVAASFERPDLDEDLIETILADADLAVFEKRHLWRDLGFSFFSGRGDRKTAIADLENIVDLYNRLEELDASLEAVRMELDKATCTENSDQIALTQLGKRTELMREQQRLYDELDTLRQAETAA